MVALGQESNKDIAPGLKHHCFTMRTLEDAYNIRNHLIGCFELADVTLDKNLKETFKYCCCWRWIFWC